MFRLEFDVVLASVVVEIAIVGRCRALIRHCIYARERLAMKWQIRNGILGPSYSFDRVQRLPVEAPMRLRPLLQSIRLLIGTEVP